MPTKFYNPYKVALSKEVYRKFMIYCAMKGQVYSMKGFIEPFVVELIKDFEVDMGMFKGVKRWTRKEVTQVLRNQGYIRKGRKGGPRTRRNVRKVALMPIDDLDLQVMALFQSGASQRTVASELGVSKRHARKVQERINGTGRIVYVIFETDKN
jgi:hypothetical protein